MKKLIITSATILFVSATVLFISLTSFAKDNSKSAKKYDGQYDQTTRIKESSFIKWSVVEDTTKMKCSGDNAKCKTSCKESEVKKDGTTSNLKDKASEPKIIPAPKKYFMIPMADSALVDTTLVGC